MGRLGRLAHPAVRTTAAAALALSCAALPVFLFGALSDLLRAELAFGEVGVGAAVTVFFAAAALGAYPGGRVTDRLGARTAVLAGASAATAASAAIGAVAATWWQAAGLLAIAGVSVDLVDTGAARAFARAVPGRRQGLAFGLKEASVPGASMLAGATLPLLAVTVGWRPSFAVGVVLLPLVWLALPRSAADGGRRRGGDVPAAAGPAPAAAPHAGAAPSRRPLAALALMAVACAAGVGAANAAAAFLAPGASAVGWSPGAAGALLAGASGASIAVRVVIGGVADRHPRREMAITAALLGLGAVGALGMAVDAVAATLAGAVVMLGAGWGWSALAFLAAVRADPDRPAAAAGIVLTGLAAGGAMGPLAFGALVSAAGYPPAWTGVAAAMALAALIAGAAHRRLGRPRHRGEVQRA